MESKAFDPDPFWRERSREALCRLMCGAFSEHQIPDAWLTRYALPFDAMPAAALILRVQAGAPPELTLSHPESLARDCSVSVRNAMAIAKLPCWYSTATLRVAASVRNETLRLRISGLCVHALLFIISEEAGEDVRVAQLPCGAARRIEFPGLALQQTALAFYPIPDAQITLVRAEELRVQRRWYDALREYDRALQLDDQCYQAWRGKAYTLRELDRRKVALECASKAVEIDPEYALGWRCKGALLRDLGRHEEGLACYERGLALDESDEILWQNKVNALNALGRKKEAEETARLLFERFRK